MLHRRTISLAPLLALAGPFACIGERPSNLGVTEGRLAPCPNTANCVSSDATDEAQYVEPFTLSRPPDVAWSDVRETVKGLPRVTVLEESEDYLRAEFRSAIFRFVDDVELHRRDPGGVVAIRSASRVGKGDLGANRKRVEGLREVLQSRGAIQ